MSQEQFVAMMPYICADLVKMIVQKQHLAEEAAICKLNASQLYAVLEREETKIWQYSTQMLYSLLEQEEQTGTIRFPDV